jgi:hypothetical protein
MKGTPNEDNPLKSFKYASLRLKNNININIIVNIKSKDV